MPDHHNYRFHSDYDDDAATPTNRQTFADYLANVRRDRETLEREIREWREAIRLAPYVDDFDDCA